MSLPSGTAAAAAADGDFDRISSRRLGTYLRGQRPPTPAALWAIAERVNACVIGGRGEAHRADARDLLADTQADVACLDPPYPSTARYEREYAALFCVRPTQAAEAAFSRLAWATRRVGVSDAIRVAPARRSGCRGRAPA